MKCDISDTNSGLRRSTVKVYSNIVNNLIKNRNSLKTKHVVDTIHQALIYYLIGIHYIPQIRLWEHRPSPLRDRSGFTDTDE